MLLLVALLALADLAALPADDSPTVLAPSPVDASHADLDVATNLTLVSAVSLADSNATHLAWRAWFVNEGPTWDEVVWRQGCRVAFEVRTASGQLHVEGVAGGPCGEAEHFRLGPGEVRHIADLAVDVPAAGPGGETWLVRTSTHDATHARVSEFVVEWSDGPGPLSDCTDPCEAAPERPGAGPARDQPLDIAAAVQVNRTTTTHLAIGTYLVERTGTSTPFVCHPSCTIEWTLAPWSTSGPTSSGTMPCPWSESAALGGGGVLRGGIHALPATDGSGAPLADGRYSLTLRTDDTQPPMQSTMLLDWPPRHGRVTTTTASVPTRTDNATHLGLTVVPDLTVNSPEVLILRPHVIETGRLAEDLSRHDGCLLHWSLSDAADRLLDTGTSPDCDAWSHWTVPAERTLTMPPLGIHMINEAGDPRPDGTYHVRVWTGEGVRPFLQHGLVVEWADGAPSDETPSVLASGLLTEDAREEQLAFTPALIGRGPGSSVIAWSDGCGFTWSLVDARTETTRWSVSEACDWVTSSVGPHVVHQAGVFSVPMKDGSGAAFPSGPYHLVLEASDAHGRVRTTRTLVDWPMTSPWLPPTDPGVVPGVPVVTGPSEFIGLPRPVGVAVAATGGLTALGLVGTATGAATHESLRWTVWLQLVAFAALITKGSETPDGEYQQGRIVGYLAAHQGCHLSALIRGLGLGNHQAAHHLRILRDRGLIWHRRDGRRLRFYTADVPHDTAPEELPLPLLIMAPDSVLMQLLRELAVVQRGERPPTQSELAARMACSQSVVSHHLRTLRLHGVVASKRAGTRTRHLVTAKGRRIAAGSTEAEPPKDPKAEAEAEELAEELEADLIGGLLPVDHA